jgi:hypothetical protein
VQEENGRKSSTREFLSFVPTACFEATTMKVADIFFHLWKKEKKPKKGSESLSKRPLHNRACPEDLLSLLKLVRAAVMGSSPRVRQLGYSSLSSFFSYAYLLYEDREGGYCFKVARASLSLV